MLRPNQQPRRDRISFGLIQPRWFQSGLASWRTGDESSRERKPQTARPMWPATESIGGYARTNHAQSGGLEDKRAPAAGDVLYLDLPFYGSFSENGAQIANPTVSLFWGGAREN